MAQSSFEKEFFANTNLTPSQTKKMVVEGLKGTHFGELFQEISQTQYISKDKGKYSVSLGNGSSGFGFRAGQDERVGYCYSDIFNKASLTNAIKAARQVLKGHKGKQALTFAKHKKSFYPKVNPLETLELATLIQKIDEIEAYTQSLDPNITNVAISCSLRSKAVQVITANGKTLSDLRPMTSLIIEITYNKDGKVTKGKHILGGRVDADKLFIEDSYQHAAKNALRQAKILQIAKEAPAGTMDIVLSPGWSGVLLHEAVGHGLEGDFNRKAISVYSGKIGQQVAAKGVTVIDQGDLPGERGSLHFDDEGTLTQKNVLIEDGVLKGYMQDRKNAHLMNDKPTGNGRRESYQYAPMPRMTTTYFQNGEYSPKEIIASVKDGLFVTDMGGGQVDITSGKFNMEATLAYRIRNGKIEEPVKGAMLIGDGLTVIQSITMMGNDLELARSSGTCGKNGQGVPVGIGQPTLRVSNMTIGGTGA